MLTYLWKKIDKVRVDIAKYFNLEYSIFQILVDLKFKIVWNLIKNNEENLVFMVIKQKEQNIFLF